MKRTIFLIALSALLVACGGSKSSDEQSASQTETVTNEGSFEAECRKVYQQVETDESRLRAVVPFTWATRMNVCGITTMSSSRLSALFRIPNISKRSISSNKKRRK